MSQEKKQYFVTHLLDWYQTNKRDLPWRKSKNPYYIWISEIMLQQTRVDTVIPYFNRFIEKFPTVQALAEAPEEEVLKSWEGLGYYSRARNLHQAAKEMQANYDAKVPDNKQDIASLKGIGPYTAGAILSIAYNQPEPAVDGNVMRVLSRYFCITEDVTKASTRVHMEQLVREMIPHDAAGDFNEALMEIGALVCKPKSPLCLHCPVMTHCEGRLQGLEEKLPVKKKSKPPRIEHRLVTLMEGSGKHEGKILIRQRPEQGLLASMWELPHIQIADHSLNDSIYLSQVLSVQDHLLQPFRFLLEIQHIFSHIQWNMQVYVFKVTENYVLPELEGANARWISLKEVEQYPFPNVFLRILQYYQGYSG